MIWRICLRIVCRIQNEEAHDRDMTDSVGPRLPYYLSDLHHENLVIPGEKRNTSVKMANASAAEAVEISEIEHNLGEFSSANLDTAKTLFNLNGFVAWRSLWLGDNRDVERETLSVLHSLPTENDFTYVKARSLLPREIVYNKVRRDVWKRYHLSSR